MSRAYSGCRATWRSKVDESLARFSIRTAAACASRICSGLSGPAASTVADHDFRVEPHPQHRGRIAQPHRLRQLAAADALHDARGVAPLVAEHRVRAEPVRQRDGEGGRSAERAVLARREPRKAAEVEVECGQALEAGGVRGLRHRRAAGQRAAGGGHPLARQERGGRRVKVAAEQRVQLRGADAGRGNQRRRVGKGGRIAAHVRGERLQQVDVGIVLLVEVVRPAAAAGAQAGGARLVLRAEEADVLRQRLARRARGQAVDARREHAGDEPAVAGGVASVEPLEHPFASHHDHGPILRTRHRPCRPDLFAGILGNHIGLQR